MSESIEPPVTASAASILRILPARTSPPERRVVAFGIDLGTTNSTIARAVWRRGAPAPVVECLPIEQDLPGAGSQPGVLVPSFVAIHDGGTWVGEGARRLRAEMPELPRNERIFWECKNDIGVERTYHRAPEGFRNAAEIAGHVLRFLDEAALEAEGDDLAHEPGFVTCGEAPKQLTVVTVPASFQANQRLDTLEACRLGGLSVGPGQLLDEPLAAFLDFLVRHGAEALGDGSRERTLLVFDFGGGTCDVAVVRLRPAAPGHPIDAAPLAVSRYHRLGGGDIDAAILHEVLVPQLLAQNGLEPLALSYADIVRHVTPALIHLAELLKMSLCREVAHRRAFGAEGADGVCVTYPGVHEVPLEDRTLRLESPTLTQAAFEKLLVPFLDPDVLVAKDDDFRLTCSIFAPIENALGRAHTPRERIDACLLVGGSTLIPQVVDAVKAHFSKSRLFVESDPELAQTAVARGAAWHALALKLGGHGLVRPVTADTLSLRTAGGLRELVGAGEPLPIPAEGWNELRLVVPEASLSDPVPLRVEVLNGAGEEVVAAEWPIDPPVKKNEPLVLKYRLDENQALHLELRLAQHPDRGAFRCKKTNPLTNVVNPQPMRLELAQAEERLRSGERSGQLVERAAELCSELGHFRKAFDFWKARLAMEGRPNAGILNRMGILVDRMRDNGRAEKLYSAAADASPGWSIPLLNLALLQKCEGKWPEARRNIERSMKLERGVAQLVLSAQIAEGEGDTKRRDADLTEALRIAGPLTVLDDWELGWFTSGARMKGADAFLRAAQAERKRRYERPDSAPRTPEGVLPAEAPMLVRAS